MKILHIYTINGFIITSHDKNYNSMPPLHNLISPAFIEYDEQTGNISYLSWSIAGKGVHRQDKPATFKFKKGNIKYKCYLINDIWHNELGPARIWYTDTGDIEKQYYHLNCNYIGDTYAEFVSYLKEYDIQMYTRLLKKESISIFD